MVRKTAATEAPAAQDIEPAAAPLPARITMVDRAFYEIGASGVHCDLMPGTVVTNPDIIKEVIARGAAFY